MINIFYVYYVVIHVYYFVKRDIFYCRGCVSLNQFKHIESIAFFYIRSLRVGIKTLYVFYSYTKCLRRKGYIAKNFNFGISSFKEMKRLEENTAVL